MQILEEYQEVIHRDASEISYLWKVVQILSYLSCVISGYVCSVLFYIIWEHAFEGNCPLWAKSVSMLSMQLEPDHNYNEECLINSNHANWWKHVVTDYDYENRCAIYLVTCFLSCIFGTMWLALFLMCGKGGHDTTIYFDEAPWRIVFPAIFFNFIFLLVTTYSTFTLKEGYNDFTNDLRNIFFEICGKYNVNDDARECDIVQSYVNEYNFHDHDVCNIFVWLKVFSSLMTWSWITGFIVLLLRMILVVDFRILKIRIYELSQNHTVNSINVDKTEKSNEKHKEKKS